MRLARTQREAVRVLGQLDGPAAWRALTQDTTAAGYIRYEAACSLGRLGDLAAAAAALLALAQDSKQLELRAEAALAAGEFGQKEAALAIVKEMLEDPKVYAHARCRAALAVGLLGQPETAMPILLELVNKKAELLSARSDAAEAVCRLGQAEAVILPLVAMAREEWIYDCGSGAPAGGASNSCEQIKALRILGQYAPADVLPALERMARQAVSRQVRQAAVDAVRQIRFRCAG
jgi:HEAT repeat protein